MPNWKKYKQVADKERGGVKLEFKAVFKPFEHLAETVTAPKYIEGDKNNIALTTFVDKQPTEIEQLTQLVKNMDIPWPEKFLLCLLFRNGLRVSEICDPSTMLWLGDGTIAVWSPKQKKYKICPMGEYKQDAWTDSSMMTVQYWRRSRQYYWRLLQSIMPHILSQRIYNQPVTHAPRNIIAQETYEFTGNIEAVMQAIGVVDYRSACRYLTPQQLRHFYSVQHTNNH